MKVKDIIDKHSKLELDLSSANVDKKKFVEMSKEYSELSSIIDEAKFYRSFDQERKDLEKIINDENSDVEMKNLANSELSELIFKKDKIQRKLIMYLLPKDEADKKNAIIEIRAGTGGLEASLFASDLFKMYEKVSNKKKWILELISISTTSKLLGVRTESAPFIITSKAPLRISSLVINLPANNAAVMNVFGAPFLTSSYQSLPVIIMFIFCSATIDASS